MQGVCSGSSCPVKNGVTQHQESLPWWRLGNSKILLLAGWIVTRRQGSPNILWVDDSPCERLASPPGLTMDPENWTRFVGNYELSAGTLMPDRALQVDVEGQMLFLTFRAQRMRCLPIAATTFACDAGYSGFAKLGAVSFSSFSRQCRRDEYPAWPANRMFALSLRLSAKAGHQQTNHRHLNVWQYKGVASAFSD
jgi:hypothetical protein